MFLRRMFSVVFVFVLVVPCVAVAYRPRLRETSFLGRFPGLGDCLDEISRVAVEEEHLKKLMEEEYLHYKGRIGLSHDEIFKSSISDFSYQRTFLDIHHSFFDINNKSNNVINNHVLKPRPLPTGNILYVGGSGPGNYSKIQDAINASTDGDTVFVYNDSSPYYENIIVNKSINLIGEEKNSTIIDGTFSGKNVVCIYADWIKLSNFTIRYSGYQNKPYGIEIAGSFIEITHNIISQNWNGIILHNCINTTFKENIISNNSNNAIYLIYSEMNLLSNNVIIYNSWGIYGTNESSNNTFINNTISNNYGIGIALAEYSDTNIIVDNTITNNKIGIYLDFSRNNIIKSNNISSNKDRGIILHTYANKNNIINNTITYNDLDGIECSNSHNNTIADNTISNNKMSGIFAYSAQNNTISSNVCQSNRLDGIGLNSRYCTNNILENNICLNNMKGIAIRGTKSNVIHKNQCHQNQQGILLNNAILTKITNNNCSYNSIAIYLYNSKLNCLLKNNCNHNDFHGLVLENSSAFNLLSYNVAGPYNWVGIIIQTSTFNWLLYNDVIGNVGYGVVLLKTIDFGMNHLHLNNVYDNGAYDLGGLACYDNVRGNFWGGALIRKRVFGWVLVWPLLKKPVDTSNIDLLHGNFLTTFHKNKTYSEFMNSKIDNHFFLLFFSFFLNIYMNPADSFFTNFGREGKKC
jgi:parallel beta-helix repeat protein